MQRNRRAAAIAGVTMTTLRLGVEYFIDFLFRARVTCIGRARAVASIKSLDFQIECPDQ